jgi:hypothetical protein
VGVMFVRWALMVLPFSAVGMYLLGAWMMSLYGLDPPYIYFNAGVILELASFCLATAALIIVAFITVRRFYRAIFRTGKSH